MAGQPPPPPPPPATSSSPLTKCTSPLTSYQSGRNGQQQQSPQDNGVTLRKMDYLTTQERKNRWIIAGVVCLFVAIVVALVVWRLKFGMTVAAQRYDDLEQQQHNNIHDLYSYPIYPSDDTLGGVGSKHHHHATVAALREWKAAQILRAQTALNDLNTPLVHDEDGNNNQNGSTTATPVVVSAGCEATVLLVRACEHDSDDVSRCSYLGYERAAHLATLFDQRWPQPSRLFAVTLDTNESTDNNTPSSHREHDTLVPSSKRTMVDIEDILLPQHNNNNNNGTTTTSSLETFVSQHMFPALQRGTSCGTVAVVTVKHTLLPQLGAALGCGPQQGCPLVYPVESHDAVWHIKLVHRPIGPTMTRTKVSSLSSAAVPRPGPDQIPPVATTVNAAAVVDAAVTTTNTASDTKDQGQPVPQPPRQRRRLNHNHNHRHRPHKTSTAAAVVGSDDAAASTENNDDDDRATDAPAAWHVFGSVIAQHFDPLQFSHRRGDYPDGGTPFGGRWKDEF